MNVLKKETVHMKDRDVVENKLLQLIKGGPSKLQVISDFDHTLTRVHKDGVRCATTYGILKQPDFITEDYRYQASCLFDYYHPIENDPHLTKAEKIPYMLECHSCIKPTPPKIKKAMPLNYDVIVSRYSKGLNLMPISGVSKDKVPEMVEASNVCLREGCDTVFESLSKHDVPLLIFSAGIGDILKEVLKQRNLLLPNMKIIANYLKFDEKNKLIGYRNSLIHTFNKNQSSIANNDYFHTLKSRNNVILMGDSLGDLDMSEGAQDVHLILRIGFLNHRVEESLTDYMDAFDIVLTDDQTMDVVNGLLQNILC